MNSIAIVDYGMGNIKSIRNAFSELGSQCDLVSEPEAISKYDRIILPGVGAFGEAAQRLNGSGLAAALKERRDRGALLVGICLGMQLMCNSSEESPGAAGLGFFDVPVTRLEETPAHKVPHIGWTEIKLVRPHWVLDGIDDLADMYFLHSFAAPADNGEAIVVAGHSRPFAGILASGNVIGIQFHPEKSQKMGLRLLKNVLEQTSW